MKRKKVIIIAALAGSIICLSKAHTAYAMDGWVENQGEWHYLDGSGQMPSNVWKQSGDAWYYLGPDGVMEKNAFIDAPNGLYYVDENGRRVESSWIMASDQKNGAHEEGWYYFGANGRACNGTTGMKKKINGQTYIFDGNGKMETGWLDEDGDPLSDRDSPIEDGVYYAGEDGALWNNRWMDYSSMEDFMTTDLDSGIDGRDYNDYSTVWMYFDNSFKRIRGRGDRLRQKVINGNTYGFDENGVMAPWWSRVASSSNAQPDGSDAKEPVKFYSSYNGGKLLKDTWFWMYPSEGMDEDDHRSQEYSWWHTNNSGGLYKNVIKKIHGKNFAFDSLGRMQTGFVLFEGRSNFVAQYNLDLLTGEQFKDGDIPGTEGSDLYLFSPDELNDGSMQTGKNIKVELSDGEYTFGFGSNGVAYGNGNQLQRVQDTYYINGLRLEADENYKYGVVENKNGDCYVVDVKGQKVTGDKKVIKDGDGGWILLLNGKFMARVTDEDKPRWYDGEEGPGFYHYDSSTRGKDRYGSLITREGMEPDTGGLASEEMLYIESEL